MKIYAKECAAIALALAGAMSMGAQSTTKLTATKANDYGLVYSLPNTVLDITLEIEYTEHTPGEFYNYANRTLNAPNAITEHDIKATVKSVTITPRGEANPESRYLMDFKGGGVVDIYLNESNLPVAINTTKMPATKQPKLPVAQKAAPTPLEVPAAQQAVTQDMTMSSAVSKKAQLAAERIFELREYRNDLISGQADNTPPDGQAMKLALDNLEAQEAALMAMFVGTEKKWTEVSTVTYVPDTEPVKNFILTRLSPLDGLVSADDLSGVPVYLSIDVLSEGKMPTDDKGQPKPFPKNGVAYQIPGTAQVTVAYDGNVLKSQQVDLAQLGIAYGLDPKLFNDKKAPAYLILDPATGAIVTLGVKEM